MSSSGCSGSDQEAVISAELLGMKGDQKETRNIRRWGKSHYRIRGEFQLTLKYLIIEIIGKQATISTSLISHGCGVSQWGRSPSKPLK